MSKEICWTVGKIVNQVFFISSIRFFPSSASLNNISKESLGTRKRSDFPKILESLYFLPKMAKYDKVLA